MTEQELIQKLQSLKQIKPRENWVLFTKNQILNNNIQEEIINKANYAKVFNNVLDVIFSRKLSFAYSFLALLLVLVGTYSFLGIYPLQKIKMDAETELKNNFKIMAEKSQNLAAAIENEPQKVEQAIEETKTAVKNATESVKNATESVKEDPSLMEAVALETIRNRTYLNVAGREDLKETNEEFYNMTLKALFEYYGEKTITEDQEKELESIKNSHEKGEIISIVGVELITKTFGNTGE